MALFFMSTFLCIGYIWYNYGTNIKNSLGKILRCRKKEGKISFRKKNLELCHLHLTRLSTFSFHPLSIVFIFHGYLFCSFTSLMSFFISSSSTSIYVSFLSFFLSLLFRASFLPFPAWQYSEDLGNSIYYTYIALMFLQTHSTFFFHSLLLPFVCVETILKSLMASPSFILTIYFSSLLYLS